ncbi:DegV family protein [Enterococcus sp. BWB1-3]|uniref:DegV family protein n=1 Tax=unclassified Enterococcus TaxID=2608891 RepID=UPI001922293B|nr:MULTISPECIES: DegV family protein [unclassified Enterococcus]MBL1230108.1 DegV family protein [Enterococcus sp. BWB1-3]MCB5950989.1 DegV family protein [Enterococcus sp. BWT-B8]MCB5955181.1 DegV family protein [Enterococcus sp. CWB-B31]
MNKQKIAILVDSGTDVPQELIEKYGIYVIPLQIIYKDRVYTDKVDITPEEVYKRLPVEIPSTSLPDGDTITKIFEKIKADGFEKILAITISSGLSGTFNIVRLISEEFKDVETFCLDTKNIGIGSGLQVIEAAKMVEAEMPWAEMKVRLSENVEKSTVYFNVATLEYLQKGGRIGLVASILGNALKLNPIISCNEEGVYYTVAKARGRKKSLEKTLSLIKEFIGNHKKVVLAVAHGEAEEEAKTFYQKLKENFPQAEEIYFGTISPALVVHTGPGLLGIGVQILD